MTYYGGKDLAAAFRTVRNNTLQIAREIPEEQYGFRPSPQSRSIAQTLTHIALSPTFQMEVHGNRIDDLTKVDFPGITQRLQTEETRARGKAEILALLSTEGDRYASYLEGLPETFLAEPVRMPPGAVPATKSRFEMLLSPKEHEMHHRGQLMITQRMLGLVPHLTRQRQERMAAAAAKAPAKH